MTQSPDAPQQSAFKFSNRTLGFIAGALGSGFFATKGIVIKLAIPLGMDAATALTWRMLFAIPFFVLFGWLGYRDHLRKSPDFAISRRDLFATFGVGALGYYVASYLDFAGLEYISAQFDRLILLTYPFFVVMIGAIFLGRKVTALAIGSLLVAYAGLALIFAHDLQLNGENTIKGSLLVLGAALSYATYQILAKPLIDRMGARLFTSIAMSAAGVAVIVHFFVTHRPDELVISTQAIWLMAALGTVSTVLPAYLISTAIGLIGPEPTAMLGNVSPIVTIILAVTILGEVFTYWHAAGSALVLLGIFAFTRTQTRSTQTNSTKAKSATRAKVPPAA